MQAQLYFLSNQYYVDFPDDKLKKSRNMVVAIPYASAPSLAVILHS